MDKNSKALEGMKRSLSEREKQYENMITETLNKNYDDLRDRLRITLNKSLKPITSSTETAAETLYYLHKYSLIILISVFLTGLLLGAILKDTILHLGKTELLVETKTIYKTQGMQYIKIMKE